MTEEEKIEKRRVYQREYYKKRRRGERAIEYMRNYEQAMKRRRKMIEHLTRAHTVSLALIVTACLLCFTSCNNEPITLYQSESVEVVREGNITLVSDLVADREYTFRTVRVKRSESVSEPYTAIETDTIKIEIIPSGLRVYDKTANKVFTYQRKSWQVWG